MENSRLWVRTLPHETSVSAFHVEDILEESLVDTQQVSLTCLYTPVSPRAQSSKPQKPGTELKMTGVVGVTLYLQFP